MSRIIEYRVLVYGTGYVGQREYMKSVGATILERCPDTYELQYKTKLHTIKYTFEVIFCHVCDNIEDYDGLLVLYNDKQAFNGSFILPFKKKIPIFLVKDTDVKNDPSLYDLPLIQINIKSQDNIMMPILKLSTELICEIEEFDSSVTSNTILKHLQKLSNKISHLEFELKREREKNKEFKNALLKLVDI